MSAATVTRVQPDAMLRSWSPDDVAECLEGMSEALRRKIWNEIVPMYEDKPRSEVPDDFASRSVAVFWDKFTDEERDELNRLARESRMDAEGGSVDDLIDSVAHGALIDEFQEWLKENGYDPATSGDAADLLADPKTSAPRRAYLLDFVRRWEALS